jgi:Fe-S cluster biogenesis protein NfuA/nitrite reductase/ring-hydroxylating ferredoxin subunit
MSTEAGPEELLDRVQSLSAEIDELADGRAQELAHELVAAVIGMYGDGLRRIMEAIAESGTAAASILDSLAQDGAVASLLLIHDLYPVALEERVSEALDTVRPYMESHGGNVQLLGLEDGVARIALEGSCNGCAASKATLELAIKQALEEHAPDLAGLEVEGVLEERPSGDALPMAELPANGFELPMAHAGAEAPAPPGERPPRWVSLAGLDELQPGALRAVGVDGSELVLANVEGSLLAYRDACASCGASLKEAELIGNMLRCRSCLVEFDLPHAGRAAGGEPLQLSPVPLLESGGIRVAV